MSLCLQGLHECVHVCSACMHLLMHLHEHEEHVHVDIVLSYAVHSIYINFGSPQYVCDVLYVSFRTSFVVIGTS